MTEAYAAASDFVRRRYPDSRVAFLGGSAATRTAKATSDLDIFVVLPDVEDDVAYVETTTHLGWLVEAFVYSPAAARHWIEKGRIERRPVLDRLVATGVALTTNHETRRWAESAREALSAGPSEPDQADIDVRRYTLSGLVDDLADSADPSERYVIAATAFREAAELVLLIERRWLGTGKWLIRSLRDGTDHGLVAWAAGDRDADALGVICRRVLDAAGGYLQAGFIRGERPARPARDD